MAPVYAVPAYWRGLGFGGLRLLRGARGVRLPGAGDAHGVTARGRLGSTGRGRPAQRGRLVAGGRAPVRRHRWPHRGDPGEAAGGARAAAAGLISICAAGGQGVVAILER